MKLIYSNLQKSLDIINEHYKTVVEKQFLEVFKFRMQSLNYTYPVLLRIKIEKEMRKEVLG